MKANITEAQRADCQKIINTLMDYLMAKVYHRMMIMGESLELAMENVKEEVANERS